MRRAGTATVSTTMLAVFVLSDPEAAVSLNRGCLLKGTFYELSARDFFNKTIDLKPWRLWGDEVRTPGSELQTDHPELQAPKPHCVL